MIGLFLESASNLSTLEGGVLAGLLGAFFFVFVLIFIAFYVYFALAWMYIAKKLNHPRPWMAWIPFANMAMILQLGSFHWVLIFLVLIPILGWIALAVLFFIATWRVFEKRGYPGWLCLIPLLSGLPLVGGLAGITYLIVLGMVAWSDENFLTQMKTKK